MEVRYTIVARSPLHIGGGPRGLIDNSLVRIGGKVVVPGSTIKGATRAKFEEALRARIEEMAKKGPVDLAKGVKNELDKLFENEKLKNEIPGISDVYKNMAPDPATDPYAYYPIVCDPLSPFHCNSPRSSRDFGEDLPETVRYIVSVVLMRRVYVRDGGKERAVFHYCPACAYFGGNGHPSPLVFKNAEAAEDVKTGLITRVSIDRFTAAAKQERLFTIEYLPPGAELRGAVALAEERSIYTPPDAAKFLKEVVPSLLARVTMLGKHKSVGFGEVEIRVEQNINKEDLEKAVEEYIDQRCKINRDEFAVPLPEKYKMLEDVIKETWERVRELLGCRR